MLHSRFRVPRVNCLDCLDRTNVMLARISENFFKKVAQTISTHPYTSDAQADMQEKRITLKNEFIEKLIHVWA